MSFIAERLIKAVRKRHVCVACDKWIEPGESAAHWCGINDGEFHAVYYHPDCREAECALNAIKDYRCYDDWLPLYEIEREDFRWLKSTFPTVYRRRFSTREQWSATQPKEQP